MNKVQLAQREAAIIAAAYKILEAVEFDDERARLYIRMGATEYSFAMDEKITNPLAEAIVLLAAQIDALEKAAGKS